MSLLLNMNRKGDLDFTFSWIIGISNIAWLKQNFGSILFPPKKHDICCFLRLPYFFKYPHLPSYSAPKPESPLISLFPSSPTFTPVNNSVVCVHRIYPPPPITLVQDTIISCTVHCHSLLTGFSASTFVILSSCPQGPFFTQQQEW